MILERERFSKKAGVKTIINRTLSLKITGLTGTWRDFLGQGLLGHYERYVFHVFCMVFHLSVYGVP